MSEIHLPLRPRVREDPYASGVVQANLDFLLTLFEKGLEDGDVLTWDATLGRFVAKPGGGVEVVTSIPVAGTPGQEIVLTDSLTAPTYHWHLRYNADSTSSYKWECIGGTPFTANVDNFFQTSSTTYTDGSPTGPDLTTPAAGDYEITVGGWCWHDSAPNQGFMSYAIGATAAVEADAAVGCTANQTACNMRRRKNAISASTLIRAKYRSNTGSFSARFQNRWLSVVPYRLG